MSKVIRVPDKVYDDWMKSKDIPSLEGKINLIAKAIIKNIEYDHLADLIAEKVERKLQR